MYISIIIKKEAQFLWG